MFERFTEGARAVVKGSVQHAERMRADSVTTEHLLLALLDQEGTRGAFVLSALGVPEVRESVERGLEDARRRGGLSKADTDALAGLGIDVAEIVARVEDEHGVGALEGGGGPGAAGPEGADRADRAGRSVWSGWSGWPLRHRTFSREAKDVLEKSLRIVEGRKERAIGDEHMLLALTARPGAVADVLAEHGVTYGAVERAAFGAAA
ncbi:Clp protease N-terminal domain-containing protein [Streptomyces sp. NPDC050504]|uniref:Clp protease N-terminal domain-containing protein n=1 Tax=Streptomyces sp. NPDC050504 TaxID=3365618 RepID=UPI0037A61F74